ncbi:hypothetical protein VDG1235_3312 [Verrucomicrobiia bacterium DG1235]|nr:hypothetical protein VDG1235_3312 [Verrucomicrobiae bacterium DG1235]
MGLPLFWHARNLFLISLLAGVSLPLVAQHQLMTPSPFDVEKQLEVLDLEDSLCVVDFEYGVDCLAASSFFFEPAASYADGYLEINRPVGRILQGKKKVVFDFSVKLKPSRDYENCYVVLRLYTQDGREYLLPYEMEDLRAGRIQTVRIDPELAFDDLNRGVYYYHFFSGGEEIYFAPTRCQLGKKRQKPLPLDVSGDSEPGLERLPKSPLPESLVGLVSGEEALIALGVNDSGYSVDHVVLSATNALVGTTAMNLVKKARFTPGSEEGYYARKDLLLRVRFDARGQYRFEVE